MASVSAFALGCVPQHTLSLPCPKPKLLPGTQTKTQTQRWQAIAEGQLDITTHPPRGDKDASEGINVKLSHDSTRRNIVISSLGFLVASLWDSSTFCEPAAAAQFTDMPALRGKDYGKTKMNYPDYTQTESGLQYKDLRVGEGPTPNMGDTVVVDWDGYTIGYYGRIFEARNKTKGGSFEGDDKDFFKFRIGSQEVIPAFEEAITGMTIGSIRSDAGL